MVPDPLELVVRECDCCVVESVPPVVEVLVDSLADSSGRFQTSGEGNPEVRLAT